MNIRMVSTLSCLASVALVAAGCANSDSSVSATTDASRSAGVEQTASEVPHPASCRTVDLNVGHGDPNAAAGSFEIPIFFTNRGSGPCSIDGFPGVSYVDAPDGQPIGAPAARDGESHGDLVVEPGQSVRVTVRGVDVLNYPADQCNPVDATGFRVYPPNNTESAFIALPGKACSSAQPYTEQLKVTAVESSE